MRLYKLDYCGENQEFLTLKSPGGIFVAIVKKDSPMKCRELMKLKERANKGLIIEKQQVSTRDI